MRRLLIALLFVFASLPVAGVNTVVVMRHAAAGGAFCDGTFADCDDFSSTLASWLITADDCIGNDDPDVCCSGSGTGTCSNGTTWTITSGELIGPGTATNALAIARAAAAGGLTQYGWVKLVTYSGQYGLMFRYSTADSPERAYGVVCQSSDNKCFWSTYNALTWEWTNDNAECVLTFSAGDYLGGKVTGTSTATVVEIWKSTTIPTAAPTGTADCKFNTGGGSPYCTGTSCVCTNANCAPSAAADLGLKIGIVYEGVDTGKKFDNWAGGGS